MSFILALDQGTTSSRAIVFDHAGAIQAAAHKEFRQIFPQPGWVEHDPEEIWETQLGVAAEAIARAGIDARDIAAIGITNQRETTVVWDRRTGKPVHNAIVWQDRRTAAFCDDLKAKGHERLFSDKTGLVLDAYFSGTKLRWILDNVAGVREQAEAGQLAFGTIESWLIWKLTGGAAHVTDASNASRTLLFDITRGDWDGELLDRLAVPRAVLPQVVASSGVVAHTVPELLGARIPVAGIAGDQQAALFGQRCIVPGMVKNTYGTGCFMLMHTGATPVRSRNRLLTTTAWRINGLDEFGKHIKVGLVRAVSAGIPRMIVDEDLDAAGVEYPGCFLQTFKPARHIPIEIKLIAIVKTDAGIGVPENNAVETAELFHSPVQKRLHNTPPVAVIIEAFVIHH